MRLDRSLVYIAGAEVCQKQRVNDRVLMDDCIELHESGELTAAEVVDINICRLYAKVETLADVSNPQGTELQRGILSNELIAEATSTRLFPQQGKPEDGTRTIANWRKFLSRYTTDGYKLNNPPGEWIREPAMCWPSRYHEESHQIAILDNDRWGYFPLRIERRRGYEVQGIATANERDAPQGLPVSWHNEKRGGMCEKPLPRRLLATPQPIDETNFLQIYHSYPEWEKDLIPADLFKGSGNQSRWRLMDAIMNKAELQITVTGAAEDGIGIYSWGISKDNDAGEISIAETTERASGNPITDRRAILTGVLSALCTLRRVAEAYGAESIGEIRVINPNKKITRNLTEALSPDGHRWLRDFVLADFDMIKETAAICQKMSTKVQFFHRIRMISEKRIRSLPECDAAVQRHQDRVHENVTEDLAHRLSIRQKTPEQLPLPSTAVYLYRDGRIVTSGEREGLFRNTSWRHPATTASMG